MICESCKKKEATVFYEESVNGNKRSYSLCAACAAAKEKDGEIGFFTFPHHDDLFGSLLGLSPVPTQRTKTCERCGASAKDLQKSGRLGCPACYETFKEELEGTVRSIHGNTKHVGRAPARFRQGREKQDKLASLRAQLKEAIANEAFEQAAALRDEIRSLEENA